MHDGSFTKAAEEWKQGFVAWEKGHNTYFDRPREEDETEEFWEYAGGPPDRAYYMPDWAEESQTHYQMYEDTSEGTPISPVMATPEELARWLVENGASAFADETASYEAWLRVAKGAWAPSAVTSNQGITSGVEALSDAKTR